MSTSANQISMNTTETGMTAKAYTKKIIVLAIAVFVVALIALAGSKMMESKRNADFKTSYETGMTAFKKGNIDDAVLRLEKAVKLNPNDSKAHINLAQGYAAIGKIKEAEKQYNEGLKIDQNQPDALFNLGVIYKSQQKYDAALDAFQKAKKLNPALYPADIMIAYIYRETNQPDKAIAILSTILKEKPFGANLSDLYVELGLAYKAKGDSKNAKSSWESALKINKNNVRAKQLLAGK